MAGGSHPKSTADKPASSAAARKSRWEISSSTSTLLNTKQPSDSKSNDQKPYSKPPLSKSNPSPKANNPNNNNNNNSNNSLLTFPYNEVIAQLPPPPPPSYGFHMLERRTIALADGSVRSYFALPPDYQDYPLILPRFSHPRFAPMSPEIFGLGFRDDDNNNNTNNNNVSSNPNKRKFGGEDEFRQNGVYHTGHFIAGTSTSSNSPFARTVGDEPSRAGKFMRIGDNSVASVKQLEVDQLKLRKAFLHFVKLINESESERKRYLEDGKQGRLSCIVCARSSKDFPDTHSLVMHTYNSDNADLHVDHLGLHKALCILMGWNHSKPPDNAKLYQFLPAVEAAANQEDLVIWPPVVIIHNTITGKGKDGRMEGLGNKAMDNKIRDLGFPGGKSKSLYGREGHLGITLIKFSGDQSGLHEALQLSEHFEKANHGRRAWGHIQPVTLGRDDDKNPNLVKIERNGEKKRVFYGYIGTAADLCKVDFETRKRVTIESRREYRASK